MSFKIVLFAPEIPGNTGSIGRTCVALGIDLILIKQTIHLLTFKKIKRLLFLCKKNLKHNGKIFILTLDGKRNELPTFRKMKIRLNKSLKRDNKVLKLITRLYPQRKRKNFIYKFTSFKSHH